MIAEIKHEDLLDLVTKLYSVIDTKHNALERYQHFNIKAIGTGKVIMYASNMSMQVESVVEATVGAPTDSLAVASVLAKAGWSCWVSAKMFKELISSLKKTSFVSLRPLDGCLEVKAGRSKYKINVLDMPSVEPMFSIEAPATVDLDKFIGAISRVSGFSENDVDSRFHGIHIYPQAFLATDGRTLSIEKNEGILPLHGAVAVKREDVVRIIKMFRNSSDELRFGCNDRVVQFESRTARCLVSQLTNAGKFPAYQGILRQVSENVLVTINKESLVDSIKRALLFSDKTAAIDVIFDNNSCKVVSLGSGLGDAHEMVDYEGQGTIPQTVRVNGKSFLDVLATLRGDAVNLYLGDANMPLKFVDGDYICIFNRIMIRDGR